MSTKENALAETRTNESRRARLGHHENGNADANQVRRATDGRWAKGGSGNPRGRPKKQRTFQINDKLLRESFLSQMMEPVQVKLNGKAGFMPTAVAIVARQAQNALQGNRLAAKWLFENFQNYVNDHEKWQAYWADIACQIDKRGIAELKGTPEEDLPFILMPEAPDTAPTGRRGRSRKR